MASRSGEWAGLSGPAFVGVGTNAHILLRSLA